MNLPDSFSSRRRIVLGLTILSAALVLSCDSFGTDDRPSLLPLEPGTEWTATGLDSVETASLRILSEREAAVRIQAPSGVLALSLFLEQTDAGLLVGWTQKPPSLDGQVLLRNPVDAGESYRHSDTVGTRKRTFNVSVSRETIAVPADTLDTVVYSIEESSDSLVAQTSIKPGFGPVRTYLATLRDTLVLTSKGTGDEGSF